ncbi:MAG: carboxypeptidase M32 [Eubacteriaceae bacterium]|nr:carboxypeptidase M32 [Eubacteriaceae bacterium]
MDDRLGNIEAYFRKIHALDTAYGLFEWDISTIAPRAGVPVRAGLFAILAEESFAMGISPEMESNLKYLEENIDSLDSRHKAMARVARREFDAKRKIPPKLAGEFAELSSKAKAVWEKAKEENDYLSFAPVLKEIVEYQKRFVDLRGWEGHPYNTLLDDYDEGMNVDKLDSFFAQVQETVVPLVKAVASSSRQIDERLLFMQVDLQTQKKLSAFLMDKLGFDSSRGLISESAHPFTINFSANDVRITTNYNVQKPFTSVFAVMHETGHALYEQNVDPSLAGTFLENGANMSLHESQSRFYENLIGRSLSFWVHARDSIVEILGPDFEMFSALDFYESVNIAKPSLIRIYADELTYPLHIMARYEIEKEMIGDSADFGSLPDLWAEKYMKYLGIKPETDTEGILQDIHWSGGSFGYFPSYALGSAYAAQLKAAMSKELDFDRLVMQGNIAEITAWLKKNIHSYGKLLTPDELVMNACGEALNAKHYTDYLSEKFSAIYQ